VFQRVEMRNYHIELSVDVSVESKEGPRRFSSGRVAGISLTVFLRKQELRSSSILLAPSP
jgi:hypothetical protein